METSPSPEPIARRPLLCGGASCAQEVGRALQALSGRWAFAVLEAIYLAGGRGRFRELQRRIGGISQKELARHLSSLGEHGLVRRVAAEDGRAVHHELTAEGLDLLARVQALGEWSREREQREREFAPWVRPLVAPGR